MKSLFKKTYFILAVPLVAFFCCNMNVHASDQETVYLQTDRTTYITGESVFYKLYVLDAVTKKRSDISKIGYIELRAPKSEPALKIRVKVDAGIASGSILLPDTLPSGIYQFVAFTSLMKNFGEQHFFHKQIVIANRFDKELDFKNIKSNSKDSSLCHGADSSHWIKTDKQVYGPREKVIFSLGKTNSKANVAVSVFDDPQIATENKSMVETLKGLSYSPTDKPFSTDYLPESRAKIVRGRVIDSATQKYVQAATVLLSCPDTVANLKYATTNANGMFQMSLSDYYNGKELFFTIKDMPDDQKWKIEIEDNFILSDKWEPELYSDNGPSKEYITKSQDFVYINKSYKLDNNINEELLSENKLICPLLYRCTVNPIYPSDFVSLKDFPEISVEILPKVRISKHNGKYHARIVNSEVSLYDDKEPVIFLDGVYIDDINKIIDLGSERIKKIEVIESERAFGDLVFYGIISIISKTNEIISTVPASNSLRIKNDKINIGKSFVSVNPNSIKDKNIPYFKQLLYWNPDIELKERSTTDFEFFTSDNTANYIIKVEGIAEDGTPISASSCIQVNNPINATDK